MTARPRRRGSVRFDPYLKWQRWDPVAVACRDLQVRYASRAAADAALDGTGAVGRYRLMRVTTTGRAPVPGSERDA